MRERLGFAFNLALMGAQRLDIAELLRETQPSLKIYGHEALDDLLSESTERSVSRK